MDDCSKIANATLESQSTDNSREQIGCGDVSWSNKTGLKSSTGVDHIIGGQRSRKYGLGEFADSLDRGGGRCLLDLTWRTSNEDGGN